MKKNVKILLSLILCLSILLSLPVCSFGADNDDYEVSTVTGGVTIDRYKATETTVNIPETINGKKVVAISDEAFAENKTLENVNISVSVEKIGNNAFSGCENLKTVTFGSAKSIGAYAFENCTSLESISITDCSIGYASFINCTALDNITLSDITSIGRFAFQNTKFINENTDDIIYIDTVLYQYNSGEDITVKDGTTLIADGAFFSKNIQSVFIPDSVVSIGSFAFADCKNLTTLSIPKTVTSIGEYAVGYTTTQTGFSQNENFKVYCSADSEAENYCKLNNIIYELTDGCKHDTVKKYVITKKADCTVDGELTYVCDKCHYTETIIIPAKGHSFGEWELNTPLSCTTDYTQKRVCSVCKETEIQTVEETDGHKFSSWSVATPESCTTDGELQRICSVCNEIDSKIIKATGHKYTDWTVTVEPTCKTEGEKQCYCEVCGDNITEVIPVTDSHQWSDWTVTKKPTQTEKGEKTRQCSVCNKTETAEINYVDISSTLVLANGSTLEMNEETHIIKTKEKLTVKSFREQFEGYDENNILVINMISREVIDNDADIVTGYAIVLINESEIVDYYYIALIGDGDGNGKINAADARTALRISAKLDTADDIYFTALDIDGDGKISAKEARTLLRVSAKLETL